MADGVADVTLKFIVVGAPKVGKTALVRRFVHNSFHDTSTVTLGVDFGMKTIDRSWLDMTEMPSGAPQDGGSDGNGSKEEQHNGGGGGSSGDGRYGGGRDGRGVVKLQLWDIAGQEYQSAMVRSYYQGAHAAVVVADGVDRNSLQIALDWKREIENKVQINRNGHHRKDRASSNLHSRWPVGGGGGMGMGQQQGGNEEEEIPLVKFPVILLVNKSDLQFVTVSSNTASPSPSTVITDSTMTMHLSGNSSWLPSDRNLSSEDRMVSSASDGTTIVTPNVGTASNSASPPANSNQGGLPPAEGMENADEEARRRASSAAVVTRSPHWISRDELQTFVTTNGFDDYYLVSAKTGESVTEAFASMVRRVHRTFPSLFEARSDLSSSKRRSKRMSKATEPPKEGCSC